MFNHLIAAWLAASCLTLQSLAAPASAANQMGYQTLAVDQAASLPRGGGKLGLNVGRGQQINSSGLSFELLRVNGVSPNSPGGQAGFKVGDQIIAINGKVFPTVAVFAAYVGSFHPAQQISIDFLPANGGPQQAQRVSVTLGGSQAAPLQKPRPAGLSTGEKVAIGVGAAALFGCYELGCFSHKPKPDALPQPASAK